MTETQAASYLMREIPKISDLFLFERHNKETLTSIDDKVCQLMYETSYWDDSRSNFNPVVPGANLEVQFTENGYEVEVRFPNVDNLRFCVA